MKRAGFSLVELVIVASIAAVWATMAVPAPPPPSQIDVNQTKAIAVLRDLVRLQAKFQQGCHMDEDQDLIGEYGSFGELSGACNLMRHGVGIAAPLNPPLLPRFKTISVDGFVLHSGYLFVLYLPDNAVAMVGLPDVAGGGPHPSVDANNCEQLWSAYAWPATLGTTGRRAYFVNQSGIILQTGMTACQYNGPMVTPPYSAALSTYGMNAPLAIPPVCGQDGNAWWRVQ
jgi:prepilin-type N-terminal cleavage/methylation domain-containing protein